MKFVTINEITKEEHLAFVEEFLNEGVGVTPYAAGLNGKSFEELVVVSNNYAKGILDNPEFVTTSTFYLLEGKRVLGAVNIRHYLNDYLLKHGGHVGYGVRKSERRKGYATKLLEYSLEFLNELGVNRVLVTCDKDNPGSSKTILSCGGVLENEILFDGNITQRYWIEKK